MQTVMNLFVVAIVLAAGLATISIWAPRRLAVKVIAILVTTAFMPVAYASMADLLSKPKPVKLEWQHRGTGDAVVLGARMRQGEAIYLWLQFGDLPEPRYYVLPWDENAARNLQEAMREADKNKGGLAMQFPFERSWDQDKPQFYALPQPKLPEKNGEEREDAPMIYQHPGFDA